MKVTEKTYKAIKSLHKMGFSVNFIAENNPYGWSWYTVDKVIKSQSYDSLYVKRKLPEFKQDIKNDYVRLVKESAEMESTYLRNQSKIMGMIKDSDSIILKAMENQKHINIILLIMIVISYALGVAK